MDWGLCVSSGANSPPVPVPPSTFCLWVALRVARGPPDLSQPLFVEEASSRLLLFQLGRSSVRHAARTVAFGPERDRQACSDAHGAACAKYRFRPLCPSSNITNKGKSFHCSSLGGSALKRSDDPCGGVIRHVSTLLYVWRRAEPARCQGWGKKLYTRELEGQTGLGLFSKLTLAARSRPHSPRGLNAEPLPARRPHPFQWGLAGQQRRLSHCWCADLMW